MGNLIEYFQIYASFGLLKILDGYLSRVGILKIRYIEYFGKYI